jgi:hypothetical protein
MPEAPAPVDLPPLVKVKTIEGLTVTRGRTTGTFVVDGLPTDDGEFEFVLVARVPALEVSAQSAPPIVATLRADQHVIATELKAVGGTALGGERVVAIDPDSGEPVGEPVTADEKGAVRIRSRRTRTTGSRSSTTRRRPASSRTPRTTTSSRTSRSSSWTRPARRSPARP